MSLKRFHLARMVNANGDVVPWCAALPRKVNMRRDTWTTDAAAVTCRRCIKAYDWACSLGNQISDLQDAVNRLAPPPVRVKRERSKGWRLPPNTRCVDRTTRFGNPFVGPDAADLYRKWMTGKMRAEEFKRKKQRTSYMMHFDRKNILKCDVPELRGKNLACWCKLDQPCHADVLLELANEVKK